jgi:hypothetical protein
MACSTRGSSKKAINKGTKQLKEKNGQHYARLETDITKRSLSEQIEAMPEGVIIIQAVARVALAARGRAINIIKYIAVIHGEA